MSKHRSAPQEIFRSERLVVRYAGGFDSDALVVTFMHWSATPSLDEKGWLRNFLSGIKVDAIHYISADNDWFLNPHTQDADRAVAAIGRNYRDVVTAGSSMGGYQAVRAAASLGATKVIAIVPQFSIDRKKVPFETRWADEATRVASFDLDHIKPMPGCRYFVFYDRLHREDARHVDLIAGVVGKLDEVRIPFGGHQVGDLLAETKLFRPTFESIVRGRFDRKAFRSEMRKRRLGSPTYLINAGCSHFMPGRCREQLLDRATEIGGRKPSVLISLSAAHASRKRWSDAERALVLASAVRPNDPNIQFHIGYYRNMDGNRVGAVAALRRAVALDPTWFTAWELLAYILSAMPDEPTAALAATDEALKLRNDPSLRELRSRLVEALGPGPA